MTIKLRSWSQKEKNRWLFWAILFFLTIAELLTTLGNPQIGLVCHGLLLFGLILYGALAQPGPERNLALALTLLPLIRLISLSLPLTRFPQLFWYPFVAIPLFAALLVTKNFLQISRKELGLFSDDLVLQLMIGVCGIGLGAIEYVILTPDSLIPSPALGMFIAAALILVVFTGFIEELIFRGLLQTLAPVVMGRWALYYVSMLFAIMHIGYSSAPDLIFVFLVGLLFAFIVSWRGSILGVTLAHGLANVTLFLIMPYLDNATSQASRLATYAIWILPLLMIIAICIKERKDFVAKAYQPLLSLVNYAFAQINKST